MKRCDPILRMVSIIDCINFDLAVRKSTVATVILSCYFF